MTEMEINSRRGKCYQLCADYVIDNDEAAQRLTLCHGWPIAFAGPHQGSRYGHAWVERRTQDGVSPKSPFTVECWDSVRDRWFDPMNFYLAGRIDSDKVIRYTIGEVLAKILARNATYGPWHESPYPGAL